MNTATATTRTAFQRGARTSTAEWGPAKHRRDHEVAPADAAHGPRHAVDLRDGAGERPDDN
ncbi:hypothetical protein [Nocardioides sp. R-C-SC26]|uniref:hypothetical protein n=1 Tax=Nocardioides sp. R-C-SC26 TaxID=2870414 RepID=UPI001E38B0BC|nr:hypothetical protein [Nocardioides sp. R-C-SC26]